MQIETVTNAIITTTITPTITITKSERETVVSLPLPPEMTPLDISGVDQELLLQIPIESNENLELEPLVELLNATT